MNVVIHQPQFLPFVGFWYRLLHADLLVCGGGFKFSQEGHGHRVTLDGKWLTVPVRKHQRTRPIKDVSICDPALVAQMAGTLSYRLADAPYVKRLDPLIALMANWPKGERPESLFALQLATLRCLRGILGLDCLILGDHSTREGFDAPKKLDDILARVSQGQPVRYLTSGAARAYMEPAQLTQPFAVAFQDYPTPPPRDSVVQLIARDPDPIAVIRSCAVWSTFEGLLTNV